MFPPYIDRVAKDLIERLLTEDITKRLGNLVVSLFYYIVKYSKK